MCFLDDNVNSKRSSLTTTIEEIDSNRHAIHQSINWRGILNSNKTLALRK